MRKFLRNDQGQLGNGWWILIFIAIFLASQFAYHPVSKWLQHLGADRSSLSPLPVIFLLVVTWICLRLRRQPLSAVGLRLDAKWLRHVLYGTAFGSIQMLAVATLIYAAGGVRFSIDPAHGFAALAYGAWLFAWVALLEELLFRGFVFQRLVDGIGAPIALLLMAALFAIAHWGNPGMEGSTEFHFGWNWVQGSWLGFDVSGLHQAGWLLPQLLDKPQWLSGGAFGPEASIFAVVVDAVALLLLWRWKGVARQ